MDRKDKDGFSERDHLEGLLERARDPERREELEAELVGQPMPAAGGYLFGWFCELSQARGAGGLGIAPITYPDIQAWAQLTRRAPSPWEVRVIKGIDDAFVRVMSERRD